MRNLAEDMRRITYEMISRNGESDEQVITFMVQRYGEFVLYRPPFQTSTVMLWVGPFYPWCSGIAAADDYQAPC